MTQSAKLISNATATGASQLARKIGHFENNNRAHDPRFSLNAGRTGLCAAASVMPWPSRGDFIAADASDPEAFPKW
jgi:hypothetical protein